MNRITWSSSFLCWCLCPAQNGLQVYGTQRQEGLLSPLCLITCLQFGDLNPSRDGEGPPPPPRFIFLLIGNILCPSLPLALINRKPRGSFSKMKLMHQTQDLIRFRRVMEQSEGRSTLLHSALLPPSSRRSPLFPAISADAITGGDYIAATAVCNPAKRD